MIDTCGSHETTHALFYLVFFVEGMEREDLLPATMIEQTKIPGLEPIKITPVPVHTQEHNSSLKMAHSGSHEPDRRAGQAYFRPALFALHGIADEGINIVEGPDVNICLPTRRIRRDSA